MTIPILFAGNCDCNHFRRNCIPQSYAGQSEMFIELEVSADEIPMVSERLVDVEQPLDPQLDQPLISASAVRAKGKETSDIWVDPQNSSTLKPKYPEKKILHTNTVPKTLILY
eukprot:4680110-Amphidinium_carterae.1